MKFRNILFAGLAAATLIQAPAQAERTEVSIAVDFGDLDLRQPEHVAELRGRVDAAAEAACTPKDGLSVSPVRFDRRCKASLVASARQAIARKRTAVIARAD